MEDQFDNKRKRLAIWDARSQSIDDVMDDLTRDGSSNILRSPLREETLRCIVKCLRAFTQSQFEFFSKGFDDYWMQKSLHPLEPEYPADSIFGAILDQAISDLEVVQRAADQRSQGSDTVKTALTIADNYAWEILQSAIDEGWIPQGTTVVTYLQKVPSVQVIPYARAALIGIPFSCVPLTRAESNIRACARDYLSIPHEVGHYVYWHGHSKDKTKRIQDYLADMIPKIPAWCYKWREEIFADVYAALFGGPATALSCQDLQLEYSQDKFIKSDGEHPNPCIRPDIYHRVLALEGLLSLADRLKQHWDTTVKERMIGKMVKLPNAPDASIEDVIQVASTGGKPVNRTIAEVYSFLGSPTDTALALLDPRELDDLYSTFGARLASNEFKTLKSDLVELDCATLQDVGKTGTLIDKLKDNYGRTVSLSQDDWLRVLEAGGWTTKGGGGNPKITTPGR